ncbi:MAG TPA: hypothetical protein VGG85_08940 [Terracidiphilus sp.]|jgi:hypothetical protein
MTIIHIPGNSIQRKHNEDCVTYGDKVTLEFDEVGVFEWCGDGDEFDPTLPQGLMAAGAKKDSDAPDYDAEVDWAFVATPSGTRTTSRIVVQEDCSSATAKREPRPTE